MEESDMSVSSPSMGDPDFIYIPPTPRMRFPLEPPPPPVVVYQPQITSPILEKIFAPSPPEPEPVRVMEPIRDPEPVQQIVTRLPIANPEPISFLDKVIKTIEQEPVKVAPAVEPFVPARDIVRDILTLPSVPQFISTPTKVIEERTVFPTIDLPVLTTNEVVKKKTTLLSRNNLLRIWDYSTKLAAA